jgi:protoporphyrinogen oxidase
MTSNLPIEYFDIIIIGGGYSGLSAALESSRSGFKVCVLEAQPNIGGLAEIFQFDDGIRAEKYYHHWFNNDESVLSLVKDLGLEKYITHKATNTGIYFNKILWRFSKPIDLIKFKPITFLDRLRLGLVVLSIRKKVKLEEVENLTIEEWLIPLVGQKVYNTIWKPLVDAKFSEFAKDISAAWMWKKLVLRGSSRSKKGSEELLYLKGGIGTLTKALKEKIELFGGEIRTSCEVKSIVTINNQIDKIICRNASLKASKYILTVATPVVASLFVEDNFNHNWLKNLNSVKYLGNICVVLRLRKSLSSYYWLNITDPTFPFVGVIEHTNLDSIENYSDTSIAYMSRYISTSNNQFKMDDSEYLSLTVHHLKRMFPKFNKSDILEFRVWRAEHAQPVITKNYQRTRDLLESPYYNLVYTSMAHIYPEDRGTNYAIREGQKSAIKIIEKIRKDY